MKKKKEKPWKVSSFVRTGIAPGSAWRMLEESLDEHKARRLRIKNKWYKDKLKKHCKIKKYLVNLWRSLVRVTWD